MPAGQAAKQFALAEKMNGPVESNPQKRMKHWTPFDGQSFCMTEDFPSLEPCGRQLLVCPQESWRLNCCASCWVAGLLLGLTRAFSIGSGLCLMMGCLGDRARARRRSSLLLPSQLLWLPRYPRHCEVSRPLHFRWLWWRWVGGGFVLMATVQQSIEEDFQFCCYVVLVGTKLMDP